MGWGRWPRGGAELDVGRGRRPRGGAERGAGAPTAGRDVGVGELVAALGGVCWESLAGSLLGPTVTPLPSPHLLGFNEF